MYKNKQNHDDPGPDQTRPPHISLSTLPPGLQVSHVVGVALVQVVGGVGGAGRLGRGRGAAAQGPPPAGRVLAGVGHGADHAVE